MQLHGLFNHVGVSLHDMTLNVGKIHRIRKIVDLNFSSSSVDISQTVQVFKILQETASYSPAECLWSAESLQAFPDVRIHVFLYTQTYFHACVVSRDHQEQKG